MVAKTKAKCWLCLRITPQQIAKAVHALPFPKEKKHQIIQEATSYVEKAYAKDPTFFCGKKALRIIGGLLYCLSLKYEKIGEVYWERGIYWDHITQEDILKKLHYLSNTHAKNPSASTIASGYRDWMKLFGSDEFLDVDAKKQEFRKRMWAK